jgi:hypothetical protein
MEKTPSAFNEMEQHMRATIMHAPGDVCVDEAAEGYKAMDERRAIKVLLRP